MGLHHRRRLEDRRRRRLLAFGAVVVALEVGVEGEWLAPILAAGIASAFTLSLLLDVRRRDR